LRNSYVPGSPTGISHQVTYGKGDIQQRGVSGDGEGSRSGDEKENKERNIKTTWIGLVEGT